MKARVYRSNGLENNLYQSQEYVMPYIDTDVNEEYGHPNDVEANILNIHDDIEYQNLSCNA